MLVDSHCHLDFPDFADDLDGVIDRARDAGIGCMLSIATHVSRLAGVLAIAERFDPAVFCAVGIHPHEAAKAGDLTAEHLIRLAARHPRIVGFGETGLDFHYDYSPRDVQERVFRLHIAAARESGLPLIVHTREADAETLAILKDEYAKGPFPGLIHCFSSGRALAEGALALGMYLSISGIVTFKGAAELRDIVRDVPADRLLVETDAPYLAPIPKRGKRNEPAFTAHTAACVADVKGMTADELAGQTTANFFRLFGKAVPPPSAEARPS